ncbi:hypothetical protein KEU06_09345 [Pseudaminobacter sp. 19-2017]|uniref:Uncharacterized protein n=1 Tax=Pseudaminobacter soli (ex Zhang et al. 2022) TaxID=2831468 RepID=A0A942DWP8_9HYPH|nr:hypothetical protein [Pseudaminobacter soli]MBS3648809.1 hypothetical protein [Pseudaminobacter soli]
MFKMEFRTDNAAFVDDQAGEIDRIFREVAERVAAAEKGGTIRDSNGNRVGRWELEAEDEEEENPFDPESPEGRAWERGDRHLVGGN